MILKEKIFLEKLLNMKKYLTTITCFLKQLSCYLDYNFLKTFGTLYHFLIDLLNERIEIIEASNEQSEMTKNK